MVIFHSHVSLPEGKPTFFFAEMSGRPSPKKKIVPAGLGSSTHSSMGAGRQPSGAVP